MTLPPLTRRQRQVLDFYRKYSRRHGISPTLEEVARAFGVNKVTVFGHVAELERKGILARAAKGISRGRQIVEALGEAPQREGAHRTGPRARLAKASAGPFLTASPLPPHLPSRAPAVRILGRIAAGSPIEAVEDPETLELAELLPRDREVYALRVRGDSMIEDGIQDGDLVLVENRRDARDGEVVVAVLPGELATLKRLYREPGGFRLQPANSGLQPVHTPSVEVRGVVIGVIRRF